MANALEILITGKDQFSPKAQKAQRSAKGLQGGMANLGKTALAVGTGFIAAQASIAGVSKLFSSTIGSALKFEHQLAQIRGLTGATKEDTDLLSGAIKEMARSMPKSPAELGAGAYFIISAGITDAAEAANVLEISAKASAAGLGETRVVADAVTSTLNAYKLGAGDAAKVTDILTTTVRLGKVEASALAGSIGRILPVAAAMGVSFEEVGANLAVMTKVGLSADEAATSLRATMTSLLRPTTEAEEALAEMGISGEVLRKQIREKGLLSALSTLMEKTGGNTAQIVKIIPNVRALVNVLGTVGSQAETYADTLDQMNNAQGATEKAFAEVADTAQFKMGTALNELNIVMLNLGEITLPLLIPLITTFGELVAGLAEPLGLVEGKADDVSRGIQNLVSNLGATEENFVQVGQDANRTSRQIAEMGKSFGLSGTEIRDAMNEAGVSTAGVKLELGGTEVKARELFAQLGDLAGVAILTGDSAEDAAGGVRTLGQAINDLETSIAAVSGAQRDNLSLLSGLTGAQTQEHLALDIQTNALQQELNAAEQAAIGQVKLTGSVESATDAMGRQIGALQNLAASMVPQALNNEIIALEREMKVLELGKIQIEAQINARNRLAQAQLAMARVANLPAFAAQKKLELERAKILNTVGGETDDLTDKQKRQVDAIDAEIQALQASITVRTLEAELTNLQAEASVKNREAMQRELSKLIEQSGATQDLKRQRVLYIDTLVPIELLQEIDALERQKRKLDNVGAAAGNAGGKVRGLTDVLRDQIRKLGLERDAIDLVTTGWKLQAEAMLDLPTTKDITAGLLQFKELLILQARQAMLEAMASGDVAAQRQIAEHLQQILAFRPAQHGFHGDVMKPTLFLAGEAGRERVDITPGGGGGGGGGGVNVTINIETLIGGEDAVEELADMLMPAIRRRVA